VSDAAAAMVSMVNHRAHRRRQVRLFGPTPFLLSRYWVNWIGTLGKWIAEIVNTLALWRRQTTVRSRFRRPAAPLFARVRIHPGLQPVAAVALHEQAAVVVVVVHTVGFQNLVLDPLVVEVLEFDLGKDDVRLV
jgi:hypothetical protein